MELQSKQVLEAYILQSLNMALGSLIQGETSYTNSFDCKISDNGFYFLPRLPAGYIIDDNLYQKIFLIANAALYPQYTLLKQNSAYFVPVKTDDIHTQRALFSHGRREFLRDWLFLTLKNFQAIFLEIKSQS